MGCYTVANGIGDVVEDRVFYRDVVVVGSFAKLDKEREGRTTGTPVAVFRWAKRDEVVEITVSDDHVHGWVHLFCEEQLTASD